MAGGIQSALSNQKASHVPVEVLASKRTDELEACYAILVLLFGAETSS
jgi:hypothetical protein